MNLKEGYYTQEEIVTPPENDDESGQPGRVEKFSVYVAGDTFLPTSAEDIIIYNIWTKPDETLTDNYAVPMVDNSGEPEMFVPMSEFYDISVTLDISNPGNDRTVEQELFVTRNLVKFQFEIDASPGTESFRVTDITFNSLMQKEYLFPKGTDYYPAKYNENGSVNIADKEIIKYSTPPLIVDGTDKGNQIRSYIFHPLNFGFNSQSAAATQTAYNSVYNPALYFCESKTQEAIGGDGPDKDVTLFKVAIGVEFDMDEPVIDEEGKPVLDDDGNQKYGKARREFEAKTLNLPYMLPRNTIVKVKMSLSDGELSAEATVFPYTAVNLNPEFGFSTPQTDHLIVENVGENLFKATYLRDDKEIDKIDDEDINLIWVSKDPSILLLEPEDNDYPTNDNRYFKPAESIERPVNESIRVVPQSSGKTTVTVYSQTGLVATIDVTVNI